MDSTEKQIYRFADVEVDTARNILRRADCEKHLRQKAFLVLLYLLEKRERLVTKEELMSVVWRDTAVTDDALVQCVKEIRRVIGDDSHSPRFIKTIPKSGYRFIGTVEEPKQDIQTKNVEILDGKSDPRDKHPPFKQKSSLHVLFAERRVFLALIILIAVISLVGFLGQTSWNGKQAAAEVVMPRIEGKKTLAVMYFENRSGDAQLEWMREGLADMLITNFSRSPKLTILSRQQLHIILEKTGFRQGYELSTEDTLEIARKTRAENFITGGFARLGDKIRLDVQLHDAENGSLLATESLTVEKPERILTEIDLLSLKLARHLGADEKNGQTTFADVMTDNLEAFRYYSLAMEKAEGLHPKDALELLGKAVALDPEFAMAHARTGYIYAVTWGRAEDAKPHLEKAFALSKRLTEKDRLYIAAWYSISNLDYRSAINSFREITAKYPLETEAYLRLGYLLRGEEEFDEAIKVLRQGLAIDPDSAAIYNALGLIYSLLGRHEEALEAHRRYVERAPSEANARDSLGMSYAWAGFYNEAIAEYERALELNPNFEIAHVHLGIVYFQTGRYRAAVDRFKKYISVAPSNLERSRGYSYIAYVFRKQKNYAAATEAAKKASEECDLSVSELYYIASEQNDERTRKKFEDKLFAESGFTNRGSRLTPRFRFYDQGYIALKNGKYEEAFENFREALRHAPPTWSIDSFEDCLANAYLETGRFDEAVAEYERILKINPNYPFARFRLAQAYEKKGFSEQARASYREFLQIWRVADENLPETVFARKFVNLS